MPPHNPRYHTSDHITVPATAKFKRNREVTKPLSGLDVQTLLSRQKRQKITVDNAIPEFKQALSNTDSNDGVIKVTREMGDAIRALLKRSTGNSAWAQAGEYLRTMRTQLIELIEPNIYNNFIEKFKKQLQNGDFDKMFWFEVVRKNKLGLVWGDECENSEKTEEEARQVSASSFTTLCCGDVLELTWSVICSFIIWVRVIRDCGKYDRYGYCTWLVLQFMR